MAENYDELTVKLSPSPVYEKREYEIVLDKSEKLTLRIEPPSSIS
jgi:hypothetical protein